MCEYPENHSLLLVRRRADQRSGPQVHGKLEEILPGLQDHRVERAQNFEISANRYAQQAYEAKKYAFVSDYVRLAVVYEYGGIYLDTDVELVRPLDELLELPGFMGFQNNNEVATGLGFGACKGNPVVQALLRDYDALDFIKADGSVDLTPCPERNTKVLQTLGVRVDGTRQSIAEMEIFPAEYFCRWIFTAGSSG